jgi:hypothetical protein
MQIRAIVLIATFAVALAICPPIPAQNNHQPPAGPPPKSAQGLVPDLTGVWNATRSNYDVASFSKGDPPMTQWGIEQFKAAKPSQGPGGVSLKETNDMVYQCYSPGLPYIYLQLFPMEIIQTAGEVVELFEYDHSVRYIYLGNRAHPDDLTPTYMGDSIGHWDGSILVVDTIGLNGKRWLDRVGHPASEQMHIVERIQRVDKNTLQVDFTFDDPKSYVRPWTAQMRFLLHPNWHIMEHMCMDNKAFESFEK